MSRYNDRGLRLGGGGFKLNVSSTTAGQDKLHQKLTLTMKDIYSMEKDFIKYLNMEDIVPKFIAKSLLSDSEVYTIRNPYLPPNQRIAEMLRFMSNKGPDGPAMLLECLTEKPIVPGHMYLANKLTGVSSEDSTSYHYRYESSIINPSVSRKIDSLKFMFVDLLMEAHRNIVSSGVKVEEFRIFLSFMSASSHNSSSLFFRDHLPSLSTATTIDQMFTIVNENRYWNHFNYQLLEAVVRKFCDKTIQAKLETYIEQVIEFENTVSLSEYSLNLPKNLTIPDRPDFTRLKTTLTPEHNDWNVYKLLEARALQKKMCSKLDLPEHALLLQTAEVGSIVIIWSVPTSIVDSIHVRALQLPSELLEIGIAKIQLGNSIIYMDREIDAYENIPHSRLPEMVKAPLLYEDLPIPNITSYLDSLQQTVEEFATRLQEHRIKITQQQMALKPRAGSLGHNSLSLLSQKDSIPRQRSRSAMSQYHQTTTLTPVATSPRNHDNHSQLHDDALESWIRPEPKDDLEEEYTDHCWIMPKETRPLDSAVDSGYSEINEWRPNMQQTSENH